jgi:hypothetical protein
MLRAFAGWLTASIAVQNTMQRSNDLGFGNVFVFMDVLHKRSKLRADTQFPS